MVCARSLLFYEKISSVLVVVLVLESKALYWLLGVRLNRLLSVWRQPVFTSQWRQFRSQWVKTWGRLSSCLRNIKIRTEVKPLRQLLWILLILNSLIGRLWCQRERDWLQGLWNSLRRLVREIEICTKQLTLLPTPSIFSLISFITSPPLVSYAAILCVVTQRSSPLCDLTKNSCVGDYPFPGTKPKLEQCIGQPEKSRENVVEQGTLVFEELKFTSNFLQRWGEISWQILRRTRNI